MKTAKRFRIPSPDAGKMRRCSGIILLRVAAGRRRECVGDGQPSEDVVSGRTTPLCTLSNA